jgi:hypothetical protein
MKPVFLLIVWGLSFSLQAQRISNTALYRDVSSLKYLRLYYENDYFSTTDKYYTQGINLEYVHPAIGNFFTSRLLIRSRSKEAKFGISLEQEAYTPTSITSSEILIGDRPFAASLFLKIFSIVNDPSKRERISSTLSFGAIGPTTGGKEIQEVIHRWIDYIQPKGWQHQIHNDVIINYQIEYERGLLNRENYFSLSAKTGARAGTFNTKAYAGAIIMTGYFDDPFKNFSRRERKNQVYLYVEPLLNIVGHDATLQGGLFNKTSPYTIKSTDINRLVFQGNAGIVFKINTVHLEYFQSYLTKEFKTGQSHLWGGVRIGWYLHP